METPVDYISRSPRESWGGRNWLTEDALTKQLCRSLRIHSEPLRLLWGGGRFVKHRLHLPMITSYSPDSEVVKVFLRRNSQKHCQPILSSIREGQLAYYVIQYIICCTVTFEIRFNSILTFLFSRLSLFSHWAKIPPCYVAWMGHGKLP